MDEPVGDATTDGAGVRAGVVAVVAYAVGAPLVSLTRYLQDPNGPIDAWPVAAVLGAVPLLAWLSYRATRDLFTYRELALLAVATFAVVPLVGAAGPPGWAVLYVPAALVAVTLPTAWLVALLAALAVAVPSLAAAADRTDFAVYYLYGVLIGVLPLAVGGRLVRSVRRLHAARRELAVRATARERLRIDRDLTTVVAGALADIAERADRAAARVDADPAGVEVELRAVVAAARHTLADARRVVRGYREVSLAAELATAATLLAAAGIDARIDEPAATSGPADRAALRQEIAALLAAGGPTAVTLMVRDGRWVSVPVGEKDP